jgi:hypothetical protein
MRNALIRFWGLASATLFALASASCGPAPLMTLPTPPAAVVSPMTAETLELADFSYDFVYEAPATTGACGSYRVEFHAMTSDFPTHLAIQSCPSGIPAGAMSGAMSSTAAASAARSAIGTPTCAGYHDLTCNPASLRCDTNSFGPNSPDHSVAVITRLGSGYKIDLYSATHIQGCDDSAPRSFQFRAQAQPAPAASSWSTPGCNDGATPPLRHFQCR